MGLCYMDIHELFGNVKCGMLNCVYEREKKKVYWSVLKSMRALGMKYIFIDCISTVADENVYDVVLHAKYYDPDLSLFQKLYCTVLDAQMKDSSRTQSTSEANKMGGDE